MLMGASVDAQFHAQILCVYMILQSHRSLPHGIYIGMPKKCVFVSHREAHDRHKTNAWYDFVSYVSP